MPNYERQVYRIHDMIQALPIKWRRKLWDELHAAFPLALEQTDPTPTEVWHDQRSGFTKKEVALLDYLWQYGSRTEGQVIRHLWPGYWPAQTDKDEARIRQRLRKLVQRANDRLIKLGSDWVIYRPRPRAIILGR